MGSEGMTPQQVQGSALISAKRALPPSARKVRGRERKTASNVGVFLSLNLVSEYHRPPWEFGNPGIDEVVQYCKTGKTPPNAGWPEPPIDIHTSRFLHISRYAKDVQ